MVTNVQLGMNLWLVGYSLREYADDLLDDDFQWIEEKDAMAIEAGFRVCSLTDHYTPSMDRCVMLELWIDRTKQARKPKNA